jgi:glycosyltransferase involved in cell wall biosynthesis
MVFRQCLDSIVETLGVQDELIVVADGETDGAWRAALASPATILRNDTPRGPAHARNEGAWAATGEVLLFLDADVTVGPTTLDQVRDAFARDPALDALVGSYDDAPAHPGFLSQYRNLLHHFTHQAASRRTATFWGACGGIRRSVFEKSGGFDETFVTPCVEDIELGYRLTRAGHTIELHKDIQVKHHKRWGALRMVHTDVFARGVTWTGLLHRYRRLDDTTLNVDVASRLSVLLAFVLVVTGGAALMAPVALLGTAGAAGGLAVLNRPFYAFLRRKRGTAFMLRAVPWHWLYFVYSGVAFVWGSARYLWAAPARPTPA